MKTIFLLLVCLGMHLAHADYPIYFLLTHPRSTGTAFERVMRAHGGMKVMHQPFLTRALDKRLMKKADLSAIFASKWRQ